MNRFIYGLFAVLLCGLVAPRGSHAEEFRGIWVDAFGPGFLKKQEVRQLVEHCRKYNFNAVFVQMRRRGDAFYLPKSPNQDPKTDAIAPGYDALAEIIRQCHSSEPRIEVHCWVVSHFVWAFHKPPKQKGHVYNEHPEWLTKDSLGQTIIGQGYYLDFGHPDANRWVRDVAVDIVQRYEIDGFHWDYLRYPGQDSGYNPTAIRRYNEEFGLTGEPDPDDPRFSEWRRRQVTDFLRWTNADLWEIDPKLVISAAVFSNYKDSFGYRFADWVAWNKEGLLDICIPMDFTPDNQRVFTPRADFALANQGIRRVYVGQGAYMNSVKNTLEQLQYCRAKGFSGTVLYSYRQPGPLSPKKADSAQVEIIVDNKKAEVVGKWTSSSYLKKYGEDYLYSHSGEGENKVTFSAKVQKPGRYAVYTWHVAGSNRATNALIQVVHPGGTNLFRLNQQEDNATWKLLDYFHLTPSAPAEVRVLNEFSNSKQVVIADAVRFVLQDGSTSGEKSEDAIRLEHQERIFSQIKANFQPERQSAPTLPWKTNRAILKGTVVSRSGEPMYNAVVRLQGGSELVTRSDVNGTFAFFDVAPGEALIFCKKRDRVESKRVAISAGKVEVVRFFFD